MKKIKITINYRQLKQLIAMVEQYIAGILDNNPLPTDQDKISLDILFGIRQDLRKKLITKELYHNTRDKFKIALRYFEAYELKKVITDQSMFDVYASIEKALSGNKYLLDNKIATL